MDAESFAKDMAKGNGSGFAPGTYDVEITKAEFHANKETGSIYCTKDPTWLNVKVTLSNGAKSKVAFIQVPTSKITYNEANSKEPTFVFQNFRKFMAAVGESVESTLASIKSIIPKYFTNPEKALVGKFMTIVVGFDGNYVDRLSESEFRIKDRNGKDLVDTTFDSVEEAQAHAADNNIRLVKCNDKGQYFPEILQYIEKKVNKGAVEKALEADF
jgi:hypothetical protein